MPGLAFSTWAFPGEDVRRSVELARRCGFAGLEVCLLDPALTGGRELIPSAASAAAIGAEAAELALSVHAPIREVCLADHRRTLRVAAAEALRRTVHAGAAMGARTVVVHLNREGGPDLQPVADPQPAPDAVRLAGEHLAPVAEEAATMGVAIAVENVGHNQYAVDADYADLARLVDELDLPNVGIAFDAGHAHLHGGVTEALATFGDRVIHVHLHDNDRTSDQHRALGRGSIDLAELRPLLVAELAGPPVLEIFPFADPDTEAALVASQAALAALTMEARVAR